MKNQPIWQRLAYALEGLRDSFRSEKSVRAHAAVIAAIVILMFTVKSRPLWWVALVLAAGVMLAVELVNTAVEKLADHLHPEQHPAIKQVKDALAAAVLVSCLAGGFVLAAFLWVHVILL